MKYLLIILLYPINWYRRTKQKCLRAYLDTFDRSLFLLAVVFFIGCKKTSEHGVLPEHLRATQPTVCVYNADELLRNFETANTHRPKSPKPPPRPRTGYYSCIYIDMDGEVVNSPNWNGGNTINCQPAQLTADQRAQVVSEVAAIYEAYNVTVTDDEAVYNAATTSLRSRIIVTPTSYWYSGVSGISYLGSGTWGTGVPAFVFSDRLFNGPHYIAEVVAHEAGHTMASLRHQSVYNEDCSLQFTYRMGVVMGNSMYVPQGAWINGTTTSCTTWQNDHDKLLAVLGLAP